MEPHGFSERVQHVFETGIAAARARHHEAVGTEHQLLGLLAEDDGVAAAVLDALAVDRRAMAEQVSMIIGTGDASVTAPATLPHTRRAKRALALAMEAARELEHHHLCTEHLLLGLLREQYGVAAQVLRHAGVTDAAVCAETIRLLGPPHEQAASPDAPSP